jgi:3-deoxy-7-phosphoheptulonate synthase
MVVKIGNIEIGGPNFTVIAGPCSIESESQFRTTATGVKNSGAVVLRGGIWKMRTSQKAFQGLGSEAFEFIKKIKTEVNMPLISEVTDFRQLEELADIVDAFQVGARNMHNYSLLKELGRQPKPVYSKEASRLLLTNGLKPLITS